MGIKGLAARIAAGGVGAALAALGLAAVTGQSAGASPLPTNCVQSGEQVTCTYHYVGDHQSFFVPDGVSTLKITADGAPGGSILNAASGGAGAEANATVTVTPGSALKVEVGGTGALNGGGYYGGGNPAGHAAGGGGASAVLDAQGPLVVAGGGGGAGAGTSDATGGAGGNAGGDGQPGTAAPFGNTPGQGGGAGTAAGQNGGAGGIYSSGFTSTLNTDGGDGGPGDHATGGAGVGGGGGGLGFGGGGGGGGGYYGGGGGGGGGASGVYGDFIATCCYNSGGGGGGGGSSYVPAGPSNMIGSNGSGVPQVVIGYIDADLTLDQPSNITTTATGPNGAVVNYQVPLAHDPSDSSAPTASCSPASGTVFAVGTTQVTCSVSDDDDANSPFTQFTVTVIPAPLSITTTSLPGGVAGSAYSQPLVATGGVTPYNWSVTGGSLPPGLSLNSATGTISGTPTAAGTHGLEVQVTDSESPPVSATQALSITVTGCPAGTKANFRWHYAANGNAGGWSGTATQACPGSVSMGPQAMDGNLQVTPGTTLQAGYDFTLPGNKNSLTMTASAAQVTFAVACVSGATTPSSSTITVPLSAQTYQITNDQWYPSGDQSSPLVYQGSVTVPDLCGGGKISLAKGGTFTTTLG